MIYLLPTRAKRPYRGKYPNNIHSISLSGRDIDGRKCAHVEANCGERLTLSYDCMDMPAVNEADRFVGLPWQLFVLGNTPVTTMTQAEYDTWLATIRKAREEGAEAARAKVAERRAREGR